MAGIVRDLLEAQAPGVFFGDQASGLSYSPVVKSGDLFKLGRGRGVIGGLLGKKWAQRKFNVHEDYRMQYIDHDQLRGEFPIDMAVIESIPKEDERAEGRDFVFEITTKTTEKILLSAESEEERNDWISCLRDVASGKFKLNRYLALITQVLQLPEGTKLHVEYDAETFKKVMNADGYGEERAMEILEQYLINLHAHLARYIAEDAEFRDIFLSKFDTMRIHVMKADDEDTSKGYYRTHFRNGELQIHYVKAWTNVSTCGEDLVKSISEGEEIPYLVYRSIRRFTPVYQTYMTSIERLLNISGVSYDYSVSLNYPAMIRGGYSADRFGEIFIQEHLKVLLEKLSRFIAQDATGFVPAFTAKFHSKRIVIQPSPHPETMKSYYDASFTASGDLLIAYRSVWTNLSSLGDDFPTLLTSTSEGEGGGLPYKVSKSIREAEGKLQSHLSALATMFSLPRNSLSYDYSVTENLSAMVKAGYGEDRFGEIFLDEHLKALISSLSRFVEEDPEGFASSFRHHFFGHRIILKPSPTPEKVQNYYDASFTATGELLIVYRAVWTNLSNIGRDLPRLLSERGMPYLVARSIRRSETVMRQFLQQFEEIVQVVGINYDYCVKENLAAMIKAGYGEERFGEIFLEEHLKQLVENLRRHFREEGGNVEQFQKMFTGKTVIVKISETPESMRGYYQSSFTADHNYLIRYRAVWTNLSEIGRDVQTAYSL